MLAYVVRILEEIAKSARATADAWERRGYWVKADRFMGDWAWLESSRALLAEALEKPDGQSRSNLYREFEGHLSGISLSVRLRKTEPWIGTWQGRKD